MGKGSTEYLLLFKDLIKIVNACLVIIILCLRLSSIDSKNPYLSCLKSSLPGIWEMLDKYLLNATGKS